MSSPIDFSAQPWWSKCVKLNRILYCVGTVEDRKALAELDKTLFPDLSAHPKGGMPVLMDFLTTNNERYAQQQTIKDKHKRLVLDGLAKGALLAFGYEEPQKMKDFPVAVPPHFWNAIVLWHESEIRYEGIRLIGVRLIGRSQINTETITPPPRPGRPSRKDQVETAFNSLVADGSYDLNVSANHQFPLVRARVKALFPGEDQSSKGLGDKALYGFISPLVAAAKA